MNLNKQYMNQSLLDQAEQFRTAYNLAATGKSGRQTQKCLIDEEWSEFHEAYHHEPEENQLNELADLSLCMLSVCSIPGVGPRRGYEACSSCKHVKARGRR